MSSTELNVPLSLDVDTSDEVLINLISNDKQTYQCTLKEIKCSNLLVAAFNGSINDIKPIEGFEMKEQKEVLNIDKNNNDIFLSNIDGETLKLIVDFLKHHNGEEPALPEKPVKSKEMKDITTDWMAKFIDDIVNKDITQLYKVISAANYLYINSLLHICCAKIASMLKGVPIDEIKNTLLPEIKLPLQRPIANENN
jgi:S-phase kinase-associated protein 1